MTIDAEELRFASDGVDLYGRLRTVAREESTILLLPGLGFHTFEYEPLATWLADHAFNCFSFDYRGHGHSNGRRGWWELNDLVADARRAVDVVIERHSGPIGLFGNSLGGMVAILAGAADARVDRVAAANAPDRVREFLLTPARRILFALAKIASRAVPLRASVDHFYGYEQLITDPSWLNVIQRDPFISDSRRLSVTAYRALLDDWDGRRAVADLHKPLLLIQGRHDKLQPPQQGERLLAAANQSTKLVYVDTGHLPHLENPAMLGNVLADWFRNPGSRA